MICHGTPIIDRTTNKSIAIAVIRANGICKCSNVLAACNGSMPNVSNA